MKKCKNCIYHSGDGRCNKLSAMFVNPNDTDTDSDFTDFMPRVEIHDFEEENWNQSLFSDQEKKLWYRFNTPDWFRCSFHVKKITQ